MAPIIILEDISIEYPERGKVLDGISLSVNKGEKVGIKGANGTGKTTLLHIIDGLLTPDNGKIFLFGKEMKSEEDFREARKKIGFLFQDSDDQLFSPTVEDDIAFGPLNLGWERKRVKEKVEEVIKEFGLENLRKRFSHTLSYGEKKIVAIATVVVMEPEIFLFDEPTTALDEKTERKIKDFILQQKEKTFIIVSHQDNFLKEVCNRLYELKNGKITPIPS
ncbi:ABC transporter ATP-binding protein [bacterium]|nr:ABC transporter ATP-binding protein [bacterium]